MEFTESGQYFGGLDDEFEDFDFDVKIGVNGESAQNSSILENVLTAERVNSSEIITQLTPESLDSNLIGVDETREDQLAIQIVKELETAGYYNLEEKEYDRLIKIRDRHNSITANKKAISAIRNFIIERFEYMFNEVATTKATLQVNNNLEKPNALNNYILRESNNKDNVAVIVNSHVASLVASKKKVTAETVYKAIQNDMSIQATIAYDAPELMKYLETVIPTLLAFYNQDNQERLQQRLTRERLTKYLLSPETDEITRIKGTNEDSISFLKILYKDSKDCYYSKCEICEKNFTIDNSFVSIITFPQEKGVQYYVIPKLMSCSCGHSYILTASEYEEFQAELLSNQQKELSALVQASSNFCKGASFIRLTPSTQLIDTVLDLILQTGSAKKVELNEAVPAMKMNEIAINDYEFRQAVNRFYHKLKSFDVPMAINLAREPFQVVADGAKKENKTCERLNYHEVAYYFATTLSLNYNVTKNRALFSLLFYFKETPILDEILSSRKVWDLKNELALISSTTKNVALIPSDVMNELFILFVLLGGADECIQDTQENREEVIRFLQDKKSDIQEELRIATIKRKETLARLKEYTRPLSFCKFVNLSNFKLEDFSSYVCDKEIYQFFSEIADRIIINNLAGEFYTVWLRLQNMNKTSLSSVLVSGVNTQKTQESLTKALLKLLNPLGIQNTEIDSIFKLCFCMSSSNQQCLSTISREFRNLNYYRFCEAILQVPDSIQVNLGHSFDYELLDFIRKQKTIANSVCKLTEAEYYLKDFSKEELGEHSSEISTITFSRYIPFRLENESLQNYIGRYEKMNLSNTLNWKNSYDNKDCFPKNAAFLGVLTSCSLLRDIDYSSYSTATFIVCLVHVLCNCDNKVAAAEILGITKPILNLIEKESKIAEISLKWLNEQEATHCILNGTYFTTIASEISELAYQYSNILIKTTDTPEDVCKLFDLQDEITKVMNRCKVLTESEDLVYTEEDMLEEIGQYAPDWRN